MSTLPTLSLPYDATGSAAANKRTAEMHSIEPRRFRVLKPNFGTFFAKSMKVWSVVNINGTPTPSLLTRNVHYSHVEFLAQKSLEVGEELCGAILINQADLPADFMIEYQALGGDNNVDQIAIAQVALDAGTNDNPVNWADILDKPLFFPPTPGHLHDAQDLYGMEYMVDALDGVEEAVVVGREPQAKVLWQYTDLARTQMLGALGTLGAAIESHQINTGNSHNVSKTQIGLNLVENRHFVRKTVGGVVVEPYSSPRSIFNQIRTAVLGDILRHIDNKRNPHNVTATQVGLGTVANFGLGTAQDIVNGVRMDAYVTVKALNDAIPFLLGGMPAHIASRTNPHNVTKAQLGLGNVDNYFTAPDSMVVEGAATDRRVTPASLKAALQAFLDEGTTLPAHVSRADNPHGEDKTSVGLDQVQNYRLATNTDLVFGQTRDYYIESKSYYDYRINTYAAKLATSQLDNAGGVAPLDSIAQVPARVLNNVPDASLFNAKGYSAAAGRGTAVMSQLFSRYVQVDFTLCQAALGTARSTDVVLDIYKDDTSVYGQILFQAGQTAGQFLVPAGTLILRPGDALTIYCTSADLISSPSNEFFVNITGVYLNQSGTPAAPFYGLKALLPPVRDQKALFGRSDFSSSVDDYTISFTTLTATTAARTVGGVDFFTAAYANYWVGIAKTAGAATGNENVMKWNFAADTKTNATRAMTSSYRSVGFGNQYVGITAGGISSGTTYTARTDVYSYAKDTNVQGTNLTQAVSRACGYGNSTYGYVRGGSYANSDTDGTTFFNSYRYATGVTAAVSTASTLQRYGAMAAGNRTLAIVGGGMSLGAYINTTQRHVFSTDTVGAGTNLTQSVGQGAAASNASMALFFGGNLNSGTNVSLNTYQFSDDTVAVGSVTTAQSDGWFALSNASGWLMMA